MDGLYESVCMSKSDSLELDKEIEQISDPHVKRALAIIAGSYIYGGRE